MLRDGCDPLKKILIKNMINAKGALAQTYKKLSSCVRGKRELLIKTHFLSEVFATLRLYICGSVTRHIARFLFSNESFIVMVMRRFHIENEDNDVQRCTLRRKPIGVVVRLTIRVREQC